MQKYTEILKKLNYNFKQTDLYKYKPFFGNIKYLFEYQEALENPLQAQTRILKKIIKKNKKTEYGFKYNFSKIKTINDFQKNVPLITFKDIEQDIERLKKGEQNILTKDKVVYFASTSGTTSKIKLVPVTKDRVKNFKREFSLWALDLVKKSANVFGGKTLYFAGPYFEGETEGKTKYGSISGYLIYKAPWFIKSKITNKVRVYNEMNFNKKIKKMAISALKTKNITQIGFTTPIEAILFFDYIKKNKTKLIKEIEKTNLERANYLKSIEDFKPINIWKHLSLINCFKSETNMMYIQTLLEKLGKEIEVRDPGINASEGRLSIGIGKDGVSGIPPLNESFFEFIDIDKKNVKPITIDKLKLNGKYKVIITTSEGLYRYDMGDVITVTGFKKKIPYIRFYNRENFLNIAGELAYEDEIVKAMVKTIKDLKTNVKHYTFLPYLKNLSKKPRYEVLVDFEKKLTETKIKEFIKKLDSNLQEIINDYKQMRNEFGRLDTPVISVLKKGSYDMYDKKRLVASGNPKPINICKDAGFRNNFEIEKTYKL